MAEVNDRGQLLLIAGILLAVVFVALALLVNAAIYTDNVATRGGDSAGEAIEYQAGVVETVGELLDAENANETHENRDDIRDSIKRGTESIDNITARNNLRRGATTRVRTDSISEANTTDGVWIRQPDSEKIGNWTIDDATGVRAFEIKFESDSIGGDPFNITLGSTELFIYENDSDDVVVAQNSTDNVICSSDGGGTVRFDVTEGRFDGKPCRFGWSTVDEVGLQNNGSVNGSYDTIVESSDASGLPAGIQTTDVIYSVDLGLEIRTPELRYETTVRVAPGEPDV